MFNLLVIFLLISQLAFAQEKSQKKEKKDTQVLLKEQNEIRIGLIKLLGGPFLEAGYEYIRKKTSVMALIYLLIFQRMKIFILNIFH
jgi:hypothetical protein